MNPSAYSIVFSCVSISRSPLPVQQQQHNKHWTGTGYFATLDSVLAALTLAASAWAAATRAVLILAASALDLALSTASLMRMLLV